MHNLARGARSSLPGLFFLAACSTNVAPLKYAGTPQIGMASGAVSAIYVTDQRGEPDPMMDLGGVFADPKDLQSLAQTTMSRAIDEAIDSPAFQAAIRSEHAGA
jgi:hypothetical protein